MRYNIFFSDDSGGVKTVSESLFFSFHNFSIKSNLINLNDFGGGFFSKFYKIFRYSIKLNKDDIIILQHFLPILLGLFLRPLGYRKIINVVHTDLVEYYQSVNFLKKSIVKVVFLLLTNEVVVFLSKEAESKAKAKFKLNNTTVIYNIYNFSTNKIIKFNFKEKVRLGSISRLHKEKNIDLLIRVLKIIARARPNVELLIYGSGAQYKQLEKYIVEQGCEGFIKLLGASSDKEKMYSSIDAMISFSSIEGFGMTILESINYGVPVFHTDCSSGPRELMSPATNPLVKTASYEKTNVGYLVKATRKTATYSDELDNYEAEYVNIMQSFIEDLKGNKFLMEYDSARFSEKKIVKEWQALATTFK